MFNVPYIYLWGSLDMWKSCCSALSIAGLAACGASYDGPVMDDPVGKLAMETFHELCWNTTVDGEHLSSMFERKGWTTLQVYSGISSSGGSWENRRSNVESARLEARKGGSLNMRRIPERGWILSCDVNISLPKKQQAASSDIAQRAVTAMADAYADGAIIPGRDRNTDVYRIAINFPDADRGVITISSSYEDVSIRLVASATRTQREVESSPPLRMLKGLN